MPSVPIVPSVSIVPCVNIVQLFEELAHVRVLLAASPLAPSVERAIGPLNRAVQILAEPVPLDTGDRYRLTREVAAIGELLQGFGQWLTSRGVLTPTYNRHAEFDLGAARGHLMAEG